MVQPGVVHAALQRRGRAARAALRSGPVDAHPLHGRRDDRQQRLRLAGPRLRPDRRQRRRAASAARRRLVGSTRCRVGRSAGRRADALVDGHLGDIRHARSAGSAARCRGYSLEHLLPEHGRSLDRFLVGSEGTLGGRHSTRRCGWSRTRRDRVLGGARLPVDGRGGGRRTGAAGAPDGLTACEGIDERIVDVVRAAAAAPPLPRGEGWLFVEVTGDTAEEAAALARAGRGRGRARQPGRHRRRPSSSRCGGSARTAPGWPRAPAARRRTPGGRTPRSRPTGSAPTCATSTSCSREHGLDGVPYGHFGDGCVHVRIDFELSTDRAGRLPGVRRGGRAAGVRRTAAACPASTATGGPAPSCCPLMYDEQALRPVRPRSSGSATRRTCSTPGSSSTRRRSTPTCGSPACRPTGRARPAAAPRRRRPGRRRPPLHRGRQVPGRQHRRRRRDVPVVPGDPRREGLHPRPGAGAPGALDGSLVDGLGRPRRSRRRSTSAWPARAAPATARPASTWRPTRRSALHQKYAGKRRPRTHYTLGRLPRWSPKVPAAGRPTPARRTAAGAWPRRSPGSTGGGRCRGSRSHAASRAPGPTGGGTPTSCSGSTPSPNRFAPPVADAAVAAARGGRPAGAGARRTATSAAG